MALRTTSQLVRQWQGLMRQLDIHGYVKLVGTSICWTQKKWNRWWIGREWCREDKCKSGANHQGNTSTCQDMDKRECFLGAFSQTERFRGGPQAFQGVTSRRARRLLNLGRNTVKWVMHLVTGHSTLKKHLYNFIGAMEKQKSCKTVVVVCKEYGKKTRHTYRHLYQLPRYISFL